jgi:hypothetical protein
MVRSKNLTTHRKLFDASTSFGNDGEQRRRLEGRAGDPRNGCALDSPVDRLHKMTFPH